MENPRDNPLNFSVGHTKEHEEIYVLFCSMWDKNLTLVRCPHTVNEASHKSVQSHVDFGYGIVHIQVAMLGFIMAPNHKNSDVGNSDRPKGSSKEVFFKNWELKVFN